MARKTAETKDSVDVAAGFAELEEIAAWFERGEPDLDEGLKRFERASALATAIRTQLESAENRIKEVKVQFEAE